MRRRWFDRDKIAGHAISLGVGHASEPYTGIGRGPINIEGMPVLRDADGAFGSMTSDHERTKIDAGTRRILITIHLFDTAITPASVIAAVERLLKEYAHASADDMNIRVIAKQ